MRITREDGANLVEALDLLASGKDRRFEDLLWLRFGDAWRPMLEHLTKEGAVRLNGPAKDTPKLTERGDGLRKQLRDRLSRQIGSEAENDDPESSRVEMAQAG